MKTKEEFFTAIKNNYNSLTWKQLAEIKGDVDERTIRYWFKQAGIVKERIKPTHYTIDPHNKIRELSEKGYSSAQIAQYLGLDVRQVTVFKDANDIKTSKFDKLVLTKEEEQVVIGSILGDGCIEINNRTRGYHRLAIKHGEKQREYVHYKHGLLKRIARIPTECFRVDNRAGFKSGIQVTLRTSVNPIFNEYRTRWYNDGIKFVNEEDLYKLEPLGLAIWYLDDGYCSGYLRSTYISTNCFSVKDLEIIKQFFLSKYGITTTYCKNHILHIKSTDVDKFFNLIRPYVCDTMTYKVRVKQGELLENLEGDNQQPNLSSNTLEGSTTNSRILPSNVGDSNADTSALPSELNTSDDIV